MLALYDNQPTCAKFNIPRFRNVPSLASVHSNLIRDGLSKRFFVADVFMWLDKILSPISHAWWAAATRAQIAAATPGSNRSTYTFTRKCLSSLLVIPQKTSPPASSLASSTPPVARASGSSKSGGRCGPPIRLTRKIIVILCMIIFIIT